MFKTLKDAKRRVVESVLEGVGASEKTVDEEFNTYHAKYLTMMQDLNECGAGFHSILNLQKQFFNDALEFSNTVSRIHQTYGNPEYWQGAESELASVNGGTEYQAKMELIHNVYRSSCALIAVERALDPLREAIAKITPEIDSMVKERNTQLIDYDSYRRRLKALREKAETLEQNGKGGTTQAQENLQEIAKFENKEKLAKEGYEDKNTRTKQEIIRARQQSDHLMNDVLVASVVAQQELFAGAARELEKVIELLPQNKVDEVRNKIHTVVKQGGAYVPPKEEKTGLQKGLAIISGKNVPSDFKKEKEPGDAPPAPTTAAPAAAPASSSNSGGGLSKAFSFGGSKAKSSSASAPPPPSAPNPFAAGGNPFSVDESPPPPPSSTTTARSNTAVPPPPPTSAVPPPPASAVPPPPAAVAPSPPAAKPKVMVEALYDHEAEAEDELNFRAGEMVEVIETSDDGWWKGKCRGQVGLFPVNYVKTLN